jgi:DNA invertase Pin-like site-specific DNA recombinase
MAVVAQAERKMISKRTKEALAAAKKRGVKLGGFRGVHFTAKARKAGPAARKAIAKARATDLEPIIAAMKAEGIASLNAMAHALTEKGVPTARGGSSWTPMQVKRVIDRISA